MNSLNCDGIKSSNISFESFDNDLIVEETLMFGNYDQKSGKMDIDIKLIDIYGNINIFSEKDVLCEKEKIKEVIREEINLLQKKLNFTIEARGYKMFSGKDLFDYLNKIFCNLNLYHFDYFCCEIYDSIKHE